MCSRFPLEKKSLVAQVMMTTEKEENFHLIFQFFGLLFGKYWWYFIEANKKVAIDWRNVPLEFVKHKRGKKKVKKGLLVATSINHHFGPVIVLRREFVKYLPKIGTQRICWQLCTQRSHSICRKQCAERLKLKIWHIYHQTQKLAEI